MKPEEMNNTADRQPKCDFCDNETENCVKVYISPDPDNIDTECINDELSV